jgi:hypothetical protein
MRKKFLAGMALLLLVGCATPGGLEEREKIYGKAAPVITQSFASKQMRLGEKWKVYLNASDPDGDMKTIISSIDQRGEGTLTPSFTKIKEDEQRRNLSGYIYLNTAGLHGLAYVTIVLTVQIEDRAGHYSAPVSLPLALNPGSRQEDPPPGVFQEKDLGPIMITLISGIKG